MALPPVIATLIADTKEYMAKMDAAQGKMGALGEEANKTSSKFSSFANKASTAVIGAGLAVAAVSVKMATDFQSATTTLVTGAGESEKNLAMIRQGILDMAGVVGQTPKQLAAGLYMIESAGYHGAAGLKVLKAAAEGAAVGNAQMSTVAAALTTVMHDYNIPVSRANQVTSALVESVASGKTHLEDFGASIGKVIPTASLLGVSLQQVGAAMAVQTNAGMSARLAAMHLNATMLALVAPNKLAAATMDSFGLSAQKLKDTMSNPKQGLNIALQDIVTAVGKKFPVGSAAYVEAIKAMVGGTVGFQTVAALTGTHAKEFATDVTNIGKAANGTSKEVQGWSLVQKDLGQQLKQISGSGSSLAIQLGNLILPAASKIAGWVSSFAGELNKNKALRDVFAVGAATAFVGAVGFKLTKAFQSIMSVFGKGAQAISLNANTAALEANTIALGGEAAGGGVLSSGGKILKKAGLFSGLAATAAVSVEGVKNTLDTGQIPEFSIDNLIHKIFGLNATPYVKPVPAKKTTTVKVKVTK
jgi:TP901 family phage tail tape measure protein